MLSNRSSSRSKSNVKCVIGKDGKYYYFENGKRITNRDGSKSGAPCKKKEPRIIMGKDDVACVIGSDGRRYYKGGKRISHISGIASGVECKQKSSSRQKQKRSRSRGRKENVIQMVARINKQKSRSKSREKENVYQMVARINKQKSRSKSREKENVYQMVARLNKEKSRSKSREKESVYHMVNRLAKKSRSKSPKIPKRSKTPQRMHSVGKENCIDRSLLKLKNEQKKAVEYINNHHSLLLVHEMGLGKTLIAVTASQCYLDKYPNNHVIVLSPAGLIENFRNELIRYGINPVSGNYKFYSFDKFMRMTDFDCKNSMLIIDEAHNLRAFMKEKTGDAVHKAVKFTAAMNCAKQAHKVLLLTGTPIVNKIEDLIPIVCLMYRKDIRHEMHREMNTENIDLYKYLLRKIRGKVSFSKRILNDPDYPVVKEEFLEIEMSDEYRDKYKDAISKEGSLIFGANPSRFYHGYRRAVNKITNEYISEKLNKILSMIHKHKKTEKSVIYTNWLEHGIEFIADTLRTHHIKFGVITGEVNPSDRKIQIDAYNNDELDILVITKAGSEGINLLGTRHLFIMDPVWNHAGINQIKSRAIRYKSHDKLPPNERKLTVHKIVLVKQGKNRFTDLKSGDALLYKIIDKKETLVDQFEEDLKRITI